MFWFIAFHLFYELSIAREGPVCVVIQVINPISYVHPAPTIVICCLWNSRENKSRKTKVGLIQINVYVTISMFLSPIKIKILLQNWVVGRCIFKKPPSHLRLLRKRSANRKSLKTVFVVDVCSKVAHYHQKFAISLTIRSSRRLRKPGLVHPFAGPPGRRGRPQALPRPDPGNP